MVEWWSGDGSGAMRGVDSGEWIVDGPAADFDADRIGRVSNLATAFAPFRKRQSTGALQDVAAKFRSRPAVVNAPPTALGNRVERDSRSQTARRAAPEGAGKCLREAARRV